MNVAVGLTSVLQNLRFNFLKDCVLYRGGMFNIVQVYQVGRGFPGVGIILVNGFTVNKSPALVKNPDSSAFKLISTQKSGN